MAHALDSRSDNPAEAAMFSVTETPWHQLGRVLTTPPTTVAEALEQSGLDWTVERRPVAYRLDNGDYMDVPDRFVTVRTDREKALGVVGGDYRVVQNVDALKVLQPLMDSGVAHWETAGALRDGRDMWAMIRFDVQSPIVQEVFASEILTYGLVSNNHAGQRKLILQETPVRVVCANTLGMALGQFGSGTSRGHLIRHTSGAEAKLVEAAQDLWMGVIERTEAAARQYKALKATFLDEALFRELVLDVALPLPDPALATTPRGKKVLETRLEATEARRTAVTRLWTSGAGHVGDASAWEAYNGLVEAVDHRSDLFKSPKAGRIEGLMLGALGEVKDRTLQSLVDYAADPKAERVLVSA